MVQCITNHLKSECFILLINFYAQIWKHLLKIDTKKQWSIFGTQFMENLNFYSQENFDSLLKISHHNQICPREMKKMNMLFLAPGISTSRAVANRRGFFQYPYGNTASCNYLGRRQSSDNAAGCNEWITGHCRLALGLLHQPQWIRLPCQVCPFNMEFNIVIV